MIAETTSSVHSTSWVRDRLMRLRWSISTPRQSTTGGILPTTTKQPINRTMVMNQAASAQGPWEAVRQTIRLC